MADHDPIMLHRARAALPAIDRPGLNLRLETDLGIAKLQIWGGSADRRFRDVSGLARPDARRQCVSGALSVSWLAPGEWLVVGPEAELSAWVDRVAQRCDEDVLLVDLSDARMSFVLEGSDARTALAAHCPLDLWSDAFPVGAVARSLLGDTGFFIARLSDTVNGARFRLIVDQTMAAYAVRLLSGAAPQSGVAR